MQLLKICIFQKYSDLSVTYDQGKLKCSFRIPLNMFLSNISNTWHDQDDESNIDAPTSLVIGTGTFDSVGRK